MTLQTMMAIIFTILASVCLIAVIILLGWFLIWKAFLSKFRLVRELLGQTGEEEYTEQPQQRRKQRANLKTNEPIEVTTRSTKIRRD